MSKPLLPIPTRVVGREKKFDRNLKSVMKAAQQMDADALYLEVGDAFRLARINRGFSRSQTADRLDQPESYIKVVEDDGRGMTLRTLVKLAAAVDCKVVVAFEPLNAPKKEIRRGQKTHH